MSDPINSLRWLHHYRDNHQVHWVCMRSRRLIKKLSKQLAPLFKGSWLSDDNDEVFYRGEFLSKASAKGIFHVGGEPDYWGEGTEIYTVLEAAEKIFFFWKSFCGCKTCQNAFDPAYTEKCETTEKRSKLRANFKNIKKSIGNETSHFHGLWF